jgi:hypothetical protein
LWQALGAWSSIITELLFESLGMVILTIMDLFIIYYLLFKIIYFNFVM